MNIRKKTSVYVLMIVTSLGLNILLMRKIRTNTFCSNTEDIINEQPGEYNATALRPVGCSWKIIYTRPANGIGRFGNRLMEYAAALTVAQQHNLTAVISDEIASVLGPSFEVLSLPSKSEYVKKLRRKDSPCASWVQLGMEKGPVAKSFPQLEKLLVDQMSQKIPISIRPHIILDEFIVPFRKLLRQKLQPHSTLSAYVHKTVQEVSRKLKKNPREITFVGVHVRMTDYPKYVRGTFRKNAEPVDVNYYLRASDHMIDLLKKRNASNIVFLIVSDDKNWCLSNLIPPLEQLVLSRNWTRGKLAVRWSGSSSYRQDFALLSSCNHSIIAYGTYGGGAALLAGGMTVVYDIYRGKGFQSGSAMAFASSIPEWTLLY